jgi:transcriptional regulator with XRE-family HTH domain
MSRPDLDERHTLAVRARRATGLGQAAFSRLLGVANTTVYAWEHGTRNPSRFTRRVLRMIATSPDQSVQLLRAAEEATDDEARGPVAEDTTAPLRVRIMQACRRHGRGPRATVPLDVLRRALPDVDRAELDEALLDQEGEDFVLASPLFPDHLSTDEREAAIDHPLRGLLVFLTRENWP